MTTQGRLPKWLKVKMPGGPNYTKLKGIMRESDLHTVCEEARCPNIGECWERQTATFMILGDTCTRACTYCAVNTGTPSGLDLEEPIRLARTVVNLSLKYVVITSVNRDDLPDGGAFVFAQCIKQIRKNLPSCKIEVLTPDFEGNLDSLQLVMDAGPDTFNHNIETVRRVFPRVRAKGDFDLSLKILSQAREFNRTAVTKSGMMVGLGETMDEIVQTMEDLRKVDCELLTIGQYLRPSQKHAPISKWYTPKEFEELRKQGENLGFKNVASGPLVRSSYHAEEQHEAASLLTAIQ
ncbi:MAG: lipoyl synthase [SAR202 cluster bacterium]|nr:lipoyl synthase [Chloroflexota bacterium]MQG03710.1 lipoyl synthase [SAR202 cluster bacterium]HAE33536.1 lipoyl synthase [Dehalococcoidia bacterium]|tara:strand:+ start:2003 stop:2884 length:882 start_codon:yes stop_codon:yes gene_type:complete